MPPNSDNDAPPSTRAARMRAAVARLIGRRRRGLSYRTSLMISLSLLVALTGMATSMLAFHGARSGTTELANSLFQEVSDHAVTKTRDFLLRAPPVAQGLGNLSELGMTAGDPDQLSRQLTAVLRAVQGVSWISYSDEAGNFVGAYRPTPTTLRVNRSSIGADGKVKAVENDVLPNGSWKLFRVDEDSGYDPRQRPFYQRAKLAGRMAWSPPYIF